MTMMISVNVWRTRVRVVSLHLHQCCQTPVQSFPTQRPRFLPHRCYALRCVTSAETGGGEGGDDEWLPPDDSPLVRGGTLREDQHLANQIRLNASDDGDDTITVVDLEDTLNNLSNQEQLKDPPDEHSEASPAEFEVTSSNVEWKDVLRELKEAGETEMLEQLVKEYNLGSHLAALDEETAPEEEKEKDDSTNNDTDTEEEWDDMFQDSLQGLSQEEVIDELIENSPSLSQLEMDILSEEMDKSSQAGDSAEELDPLADINFDDNAAVREFRTMVWEDYNNQKQAKAERTRVEEGKKSPDAPATTNWSTAEDLSLYPPDWKDYDSKGAFRSDFLEDGDSWIPPSSELIPSRSHKTADHGEGIQNPPKNIPTPAGDLDNKIDWLQARRSRLGEAAGEQAQTPTQLMTPEQAEKFSHRNSQIPVKPHTLFTTTELSTSLVAQGGTDVHIIDTEDSDPMRGVGIGCKFILLVTGRAAAHVRVMADSLVRNLKARKLHERGVVGAVQGAEGGQDLFTNKRSRNRARRDGIANASRKIDDDWIVVDCDSVHVHIMEATTRKALNIEGLWDFSDPNSEGSKLRRVDCTDDESIDTYVAENPIPDEYAAKLLGKHGGDGWITGGTGSRVQAIPVFQRKSFSAKWSGKKKEGRKAT